MDVNRCDGDVGAIDGEDLVERCVGDLDGGDGNIRRGAEGGGGLLAVVL